MKKIFTAITAALLLAGCSSASAASSASSVSQTSSAEETAASETSVAADAVSSASLTRTELAGDDLDKAYDELVSLSNDLATGETAAADGYKAPDSALAEVISVSTEGYPSMSTIHAWKVDKDTKSITIVMTDGVTIEGLINTGDKGTIMVHGDDGWYIMHVTNTNTVTLPYSDEDYADGKGKFNMDYSGADTKKTEFTVTFSIDEIESSAVYMFN